MKTRNVLTRKTLYLVCLLLLVPAGFTSYYLAKWIKVKAVLAAGRDPYTIIYRDFTYRTKSGSQLDFTRPHDSVTYLKARKSDGSVAEITFAAYEPPDHVVVGVRKVQSISERAMVVSYFRSKAQSTFPLRDDELAAVKSGPSDPSCMHHPERLAPVEFRGNGRFLGLAVVKHAFKSAAVTTELWESPDLNCEIVYMKSVFLDSKGDPTDATVKSAIEINRQEPEAWIFASGTGNEMPPSRVIAVEYAAHGLGTTSSEQSKFVRQDENYSKRRQELQVVK